MSTKLKPRRPATDIEIRAMIQLGTCRFTPASFDKRFAQNMRSFALNATPAPQVTEREVACLWRKVWRYRRQISDKTILAEAAKHPTEPNYQRA